MVAADLSLAASQHLQLIQLADGSLALELTPQHNSARP